MYVWIALLGDYYITQSLLFVLATSHRTYAHARVFCFIYALFTFDQRINFLLTLLSWILLLHLPFFHPPPLQNAARCCCCCCPLAISAVSNLIGGLVQCVLTYFVCFLYSEYRHTYIHMYINCYIFLNIYRHIYLRHQHYRHQHRIRLLLRKKKKNLNDRR